MVLRLAMEDIRPSIWRRIAVDSAMSLTTLHEVMQICFGWYGYHLYQFTYRGEYYAPPDDEFEVAGVRRIDKGVREWVAVFEGDGIDLAALASDISVADVSVQPMTLEDVFIELVAKKASGA